MLSVCVCELFADVVIPLAFPSTELTLCSFACVMYGSFSSSEISHFVL